MTPTARVFTTVQHNNGANLFEQTHLEIKKIKLLCNRSRCDKLVNWFSNLNFFDPEHCDLRIGCSSTNFSSEVDLPALKFHSVRKFPKIPFRNCKSRINHHTIVRISLTNSPVPVSFFFQYHCISSNVKSQSARRWCQILWMFEESWGWSFSSRWSFRNVSWSIRYIYIYIYSVFQAAIQNRGKASFWDSEYSRVDWERGSHQRCSQIQDRKILFASDKDSLCSVNPEFEPTFDSRS